MKNKNLNHLLLYVPEFAKVLLEVTIHVCEWTKLNIEKACHRRPSCIHVECSFCCSCLVLGSAVSGFCVQFLLLCLVGVPGVFWAWCVWWVLAGFFVSVSQFWGCRVVVFWGFWISVLPQFCCGACVLCVLDFCLTM